MLSCIRFVFLWSPLRSEIQAARARLMCTAAGSSSITLYEQRSIRMTRKYATTATVRSSSVSLCLRTYTQVYVEYNTVAIQVYVEHNTVAVLYCPPSPIQPYHTLRGIFSFVRLPVNLQ